jgi:hypothetical protein
MTNIQGFAVLQEANSTQVKMNVSWVLYWSKSLLKLVNWDKIYFRFTWIV